MSADPCAPNESVTYAIEIANAAYDRLQSIKFFKSFRRTPMRIVQPDTLPLLQLYLTEERTPDGDPNAGEVRFTHQAVLNITGTIKHSDDETQYVQLDQVMTAVDPLLWTDPTFVKLFEGVVRMTRRDVYETVSETPLAHIWLAITFEFRSNWPPYVPDWFKTLHVTREIGTDGTIVQVVDIELPTDEVTHHDDEENGQGLADH